MNINKDIYDRKEGGYTALFAIILFTLFFMLLFSSMVNSSIAVMSRVIDQEGGSAAMATTNSCVEEVLFNFREDILYFAEGEVVVIPLAVEGECDVVMTKITDHNYQFNFSSSHQSYHQDLEIVVVVVVETGFRSLKIEKWSEH